ncbi:hypothetical protein AGABI2DRAFT_119114 [Agaricus bisporus var. bisporus H97]|uniref:hypothetical protein n=1 Tax=Agaricus bisporus var. bisporus (strain H97 / ATCC MYA-4626 / FGSC 10389) TaxID=936046 RepID=UPI00029F7C63|nr:hypothetical protein AGABI2DRAFT_119114 [Agaricus bisporus var. bisporus H97]EKV46938.1 hypothetical protein AGABI2DRAFT_119114 [Agaricus bisporus var. bisporus H97]
MDFAHFGEPTIVLSTVRAALDLLDKKGSIYSSRPRNILAGEICYRGFKGPLQPAGDRFRKFRTIMNTALGVEASKSFRSLEDFENKLMLRDLILEDDSGKHRPCIRLPYVPLLVHASITWVQSILHFPPAQKNFSFNTRGDLVDHFPILLRLPKLLQWFRMKARKQGEKEERFFSDCFNRSKEAIDRGQSVLGAITPALGKQERFGWSNSEIAGILSSPYIAGVSTTRGSFDAFISAVLLKPEVMKKAQAEIDSVVGDDTMPNFEDSHSLPYIRAIVKETLRWRPSIALGIAHATTEDDVYEGMFIPAGSTVIGNIYAITRDTEVFPEPEEFKPERFIDNTDPIFKNYNLTFGFGRRICPGQHIASDQLFLFVSRMLWAFDIVPLESITKPSSQMHRGPGSPAPPPYKLVPRREITRSMILEHAIDAERELELWESYSWDDVTK